MATLELYGSNHCPFTQELRDWLEWTRREFHEYDVEADPAANARMIELNGGARNVPVLVEDGKVIQVGWQGRSCVAGPAIEPDERKPEKTNSVFILTSRTGAGTPR